jgi:hypothetical protein
MNNKATAENMRFFAAGYIGSANLLVGEGYLDAARVLIGIVREFVDMPNVDCPDAITELLDATAADPAANAEYLTRLEEWFVDPANTNLETAGIRIQ